MYLREVCYILKKEGVNHGIAIDDDNKKSHSNNEKSTQDYKLQPRKKADTGIHRIRAKRRRSKRVPGF